MIKKRNKAFTFQKLEVLGFNRLFIWLPFSRGEPSQPQQTTGLSMEESLLEAISLMSKGPAMKHHISGEKEQKYGSCLLMLFLYT